MSRIKKHSLSIIYQHAYREFFTNYLTVPACVLLTISCFLSIFVFSILHSKLRVDGKGNASFPREQHRVGSNATRQVASHFFHHDDPHLSLIHLRSYHHEQFSSLYNKSPRFLCHKEVIVLHQRGKLPPPNQRHKPNQIPI